MLTALPDSPSARAILDESRSCLDDLGVGPVLDDADALRDTTNVQLALLIAGVASARALCSDEHMTPRFVAGHSVGAFAAAVSVGVLTLGEALIAVRLRGELMKDACTVGDWGMAAVTGLPLRTVQQMVLRVHTEDQPVWVANVNSASQTVLSGSILALRTASEVARDAGAADCELLDVAVASHCPLQAATARRLRNHLAGLPPRTPTGHYLTNTRGRSVMSARAILDDLADAVARPVQWFTASRLLPELGVACAVETHPGHVLTQLNTANTPAVLSLSLEDVGLEVTASRVRRGLHDQS
jgi:malonate decarboxylase epsilon subunit